MKSKLLLLTVLTLSACSQHPTQTTEVPTTSSSKFLLDPQTIAKPGKVITDDHWSHYTEDAASHYGVDPKLVSAIISVESGGNPKVVSHSNAIGLMQIKASTAGRAVYQATGRRGQPSGHELKDPAKNIQIGTAYLKLLQENELSGIKNPVTLRYATIVSYANGAGALMRIFSSSRERAIAKINHMTPEQFISFVQREHPAAQAPRYLRKVTEAYQDS